METCAEAAIKNGVDRDTFWGEMIGAYGFTLASLALDHYDSITQFINECIDAQRARERGV